MSRSAQQRIYLVMCWYGCALCDKQYQSAWDGTTDVHICDGCAELLRRQEAAYDLDVEMQGIRHDCRVTLEDAQWLSTRSDWRR